MHSNTENQVFLYPLESTEQVIMLLEPDTYQFLIDPFRYYPFFQNS